MMSRLRTGAVTVCGYRGFVDWLGSAAFDLLALGGFQENALTVSGAHAMQRIGPERFLSVTIRESMRRDE